jgi:hypothetical protein
MMPQKPVHYRIWHRDREAELVHKPELQLQVREILHDDERTGASGLEPDHSAFKLAAT